jgi:hypothetical protein
MFVHRRCVYLRRSVLQGGDGGGRVRSGEDLGPFPSELNIHYWKIVFPTKEIPFPQQCGNTQPPKKKLSQNRSHNAAGTDSIPKRNHLKRSGLATALSHQSLCHTAFSFNLSTTSPSTPYTRCVPSTSNTYNSRSNNHSAHYTPLFANDARQLITR